MSALPTWGVVSTLKAPMRDILGFAAWHLELGAHRLFLYLDDPHSEARSHLKTHSKIRLTATGAQYWDKKGKRPGKHQPRQTINAADAYAKRTQVDWLTHIDCDEFLAPGTPLPQQLAALPDSCLCARMRPVEALAWDGPAQEPRPFKSFPLDPDARRRVSAALYPEFGAHLNGGMLSHVAGKMIYRTGQPDFYVKIHNTFQGDVMNPGQHDLPGTPLLHLHGHDWQTWRDHFDYRHKKGAYRADLKSAPGGLSMHALLAQIMDTSGESGLRAFWEETCAPSDALMNGLQANGLLQWHRLDLAPLIAKHFPEA